MCINHLQQHITPSRRLCREGRVSLVCYLVTISLILLPSIPQIYYGAVPNVWGARMWGPALYFALICMVIRFVLRDTDYQVGIRSAFLGFVEAISILTLCFAPNVWKQFGTYGLFMAFFHYSEFLAIAYCNPKSLTVDSFMLNHSWAYGMAAAASWIEFVLEVHFLPSFKDIYYLWVLGVLMCLFGEVVRKTAMVTASSSFTHLVQYEKADDHKLITHGIYAYSRHPSYVGWFWWSIGTQVILMNPICIVAYTIISWKFFHDRIYCEEFSLLNFFRSDYKTYQQNVPTGLPFIKGFILE
ncbi:protein-S-isoprenylcysteine O-methyltransferase-like [Musca vetustissima]|uniref:protein-S-isoprenylcysteine O-methyltransferase-like n=1 Tax=Musca vetustissima TaxID=27455 RepID=UPI002AB6AFF1|nr:protein-S-isoprenylcysteine O-methyltransferase-like [Musca vetustissima]